MDDDAARAVVDACALGCGSHDAGTMGEDSAVVRDAGAPNDVANDSPNDAAPDAEIDAAVDAGNTEDVAVDVPADVDRTTVTSIATGVHDCVQDDTTLYCSHISDGIVAIDKATGARTILTAYAFPTTDLAIGNGFLYWNNATGSVDPLTATVRLSINGGTLTEIAASNYSNDGSPLVIAGEYYYVCDSGTADMGVCVAPRGSSTPDSLSGTFSTQRLSIDFGRSYPDIPLWRIATDGTDVFYYRPGHYGSDGSWNPTVHGYNAGTSWEVGTDHPYAGATALAVTRDSLYVLEHADSSTTDLIRISRGDGASRTIAQAGLAGSLFVDDTDAYFWGRNGLQRVSINGGVPETIDDSMYVRRVFTDRTSIYWVTEYENVLHRRGR